MMERTTIERRTRSEAALARPKIFGRRHSPETRAKIAAARRLIWWPEMDAALRELVPAVGLMMAAERINCCPKAAKRRCLEIGVPVPPPNRFTGGKLDVERTRRILRQLRDGLRIKDVAERHGLSRGAIYSRLFYAQKLGITP